MFKSIARKMLELYLLPLKSNARLFYYVKGNFFTDEAEFLHRAALFIQKRGAAPTDAIIIDVGGFNGGTALYFAEHFPPHQVFCVEPNTRMLPRLKEAEAKQKRLTVKNIALGRVKGEAVLHRTANDLSSSLNELNAEEIARMPEHLQAIFRDEEMRVPVSTLDDEFKDASSVLLIKLDTQGTELDILQGGVETLKKTKFILIEMNNHHIYKNTCQYYEVDEFLRGNSFRLADIIVTYRGDDGVSEYDALYENRSL